MARIEAVNEWKYSLGQNKAYNWFKVAGEWPEYEDEREEWNRAERRIRTPGRR